MAMTFSSGTLLNTFIFILNLIHTAEYISSTIKHAPVKSQIFIRSCGSLDILRSIYAVPTIPSFSVHLEDVF